MWFKAGGFLLFLFAIATAAFVICMNVKYGKKKEQDVDDNYA